MGHRRNLWGINKNSLRKPESDGEEKASVHSQGVILYLSFHLDKCMLSGMYA